MLFTIFLIVPLLLLTLRAFLLSSELKRTRCLWLNNWKIQENNESSSGFGSSDVDYQYQSPDSDVWISMRSAYKAQSKLK